MDMSRESDFLDKINDLQNKANHLRNGIIELNLAPSINQQMMQSLQTVITQLNGYRLHAERNLSPKRARRRA